MFHLRALFNDRLHGYGSAHDERVRLLSGLVVLLPVVPLSAKKNIRIKKKCETIMLIVANKLNTYSVLDMNYFSIFWG